jgi:hypothetical protein
VRRAFWREYLRLFIFPLGGTSDFVGGSIVESPRDVPYGDINLQECMFSLPTISP